MPSRDIQRVADLMRKIDMCLLVTHKGQALSGRPMSNNGEVEYDGDSYLFTRASSGMIGDIAQDPSVALVFHRTPGLLAGGPVFIHLQGHATVVRDRAAYAAHWHKSLDAWFEDGIDTVDLAMIVVTADRVAYWDGMDHGDILLPAA